MGEIVLLTSMSSSGVRQGGILEVVPYVVHPCVPTRRKDRSSTLCSTIPTPDPPRATAPTNRSPWSTSSPSPSARGSLASTPGVQTDLHTPAAPEDGPAGFDAPPSLEKPFFTTWSLGASCGRTCASRSRSASARAGSARSSRRTGSAPSGPRPGSPAPIRRLAQKNRSKKRTKTALVNTTI